MSKKKDKKFSYNNTHGHGIYTPAPIGGQRYPHTDLHHNEPFWIYEELGILKDWLISLTKLLGIVAQTETDDAQKIVDELQSMIDKLQSWIDQIETSLNAFYISQQAFDANLIAALDLPNNIIDYITTLINALNPIFKSLFDCIEDRLVIDDTSINDINIEINNIWDALENLSSQSTKSKTLTVDSDYNFTFYNGFYRTDYNDANYLTLKDTQLNTGGGIYHSLEYNLTFGGYHRLNNDYVYTTPEDDGKAPIFSHGSDVDGRNYICALTITDGLADFSSIDSSEFIPSIWNMNPVKARARFPIVNSYHCGDSSYNVHNSILITMQSIQDGFNQQFFYYIERGDCDELSFGNCAMDFTFSTHVFIS